MNRVTKNKAGLLCRVKGAPVYMCVHTCDCGYVDVRMYVCVYVCVCVCVYAISLFHAGMYVCVYVCVCVCVYAISLFHAGDVSYEGLDTHIHTHFSEYVIQDHV
jgi:hypothetical protein